ncbi:MltA domain-containing protein [uncultured Cohaesibacter sp.]|uniref:murein transglycosylase A n=1 Tax=uncultured Cohaesibacter sp. TaxID=1002546 RepID=UPI0029C93BFE|nr:MltA domain-containing protein [uncultured Cohaesibacter sp.]
MSAETEPLDFSDLAGWDDHDHEAAFAAFCHSAHHLLRRPPTSRAGSAAAEDLLVIARAALAQPGVLDRKAARLFFESHFLPVALASPGLLTGYYEPVFEARLSRDETFAFPLHKRPDDLVPLTPEEAEKVGFTPETSFARKTADGLCFHASRAEVMAGALDGRDLELAWLKDPLEAYVIHIQGSARLDLGDGATMRIAFDGKSGHPYRSLGKYLIERGVFTASSITMDGLLAHLRSLGREGTRLLGENPSYIYFKAVSEGHEAVEAGKDARFGPKAAAGVPLVPMRSIAVDRHIHTFGLPFWLETFLPDAGGEGKPFRQMVFAHDTGSAIKGAARGDLFVGTGPEAGALAGQLQQQTRFICLMPSRVADNRGG